jgi:hypothetical protein
LPLIYLIPVAKRKKKSKKFKKEKIKLQKKYLAYNFDKFANSKKIYNLIKNKQTHQSKQNFIKKYKCTV